MRTVRYYIVNKIAEEVVAVKMTFTECELFIATLDNPNDYIIGRKYLNI